MANDTGINSMQQSADDMSSTVGTLLNIVESISVTPVDKSQPLDEELISWYRERFDMLRADGVPNAITYYMEKCRNEPNINDRTLMTILYYAMNEE